MKRLVIVATIALLSVGSLLVAQAAPAEESEIRVLCSNGIKAAMGKLIPEAERATGRHISIQFSSSAMLRKSIDGGEPFDLAILTPENIDDLIKSGKIVAGTRKDIASTNLAAGIRTSAPKADISTPAMMKSRLLSAKTITWTENGGAEPAILAMLKGLGIEDQLKSKIVVQKVPGRPAESVAEGENEIVLAPFSEIHSVKGIELLGYFPKEFQVPNMMTSGLGAKAKDAASAKALVQFLTSAKAVPAIESSGMKPAAKD